MLRLKRSIEHRFFSDAGEVGKMPQTNTAKQSASAAICSTPPLGRGEVQPHTRFLLHRHFNKVNMKEKAICEGKCFRFIL